MQPMQSRELLLARTSKAGLETTTQGAVQFCVAEPSDDGRRETSIVCENETVQTSQAGKHLTSRGGLRMPYWRKGS